MTHTLHILCAGLIAWVLPLLAAVPCTSTLQQVAPSPPVDLVWNAERDSLQFVVKGGDTPRKQKRGDLMTRMAGPFWLTGMSRAISTMTHNPKDLPATEKMLEALDIDYRARGAVNEIPLTGGLLVVANHPRFGAEGLAIASLLSRKRPDVKIVLNKMNQTVPGFEEISFGVDMDGDVNKNMRSLKDMQKWLADGHVVLLFPAGAISKYPIGKPSQDTDWNRTPAFLSRRAGVPVLPIYSDDARPSLFYRMAQPILPKKMMKSTYPQEILRQRGSTIDLNVGQLVTAKTIESFDNDDAAVQFLRQRTYELRHQPSGP